MRLIPKVDFHVCFLLAAFLAACSDKGNLPVVVTNQVWDIMQKSAMVGGNVLDNGGSQIRVRGICWSKSAGPTISDNHTVAGGDTGLFTVNLTSLLPGTRYYIRAYATNKTGTGYGNEVIFETNGYQLPGVGTDTASYINNTSAVTGGYISWDGGGTISSKGVCWSTETDPTLEDPHTSEGTGIDRFVSHLEGLNGSTTYYVRAYAINEAGTAYGDNITFTTLADSDAVIYYPIEFNPDLTYGSVKDYEWNNYKTIQIGMQTWTAENLKATILYNGAQIGDGNWYSDWTDVNQDLYCWYDKDTTNIRNYGALYNWYSVVPGMLCPAGWHVPTVTELMELITGLGGESIAGGKLKETGTNHWLNPNSRADNSGGFTAMPGGYRPASGFMSKGSAGYWWSSTEKNSDSAYYMVIRYDGNSAVIKSAAKTEGMSVRCVKD